MSSCRRQILLNQKVKAWNIYCEHLGTRKLEFLFFNVLHIEQSINGIPYYYQQ